MNIGNVKIDIPAIMAPMAGITNLPFRLIARNAGCGLAYSEMVSSHALVYKSKKTFDLLLNTCKEDSPLTIQIFGSVPSIMADAATIVEEAGTDIIDINLGCSVRKILKSGSGSALMKDPSKARDVISAVRNAVSIPLTVKIRSGWSKSGADALTIAKIAEDCGVDAIAVHPRTATQGFSGYADRNIISKVKKKVRIPVIGNGDIKNCEDAVSMFEETGCDFIMIGRAAAGNPLLFRQIKEHIKGEKIKDISIDEKFDMMKQYLNASIKYLGKERASFMMRSRLTRFVKGLPKNGWFRDSVKHLSSEEEGIEAIKNYRILCKDWLPSTDLNRGPIG